VPPTHPSLREVGRDSALLAGYHPRRPRHVDDLPRSGTQFSRYRYTRQPLDLFQILVGPNASGKSTFLGIVDLIGKPADWRDDIGEPMARLSPNFRDLTFMRSGGRFDLAVEAKIPDHLRRLNDKGERNGPELVRY
jgi:hypothetical protein